MASASTQNREAEESATAHLSIEGMHCASCVSRVEAELASVPRVIDASVNLTAEEATIHCAPGTVELPRHLTSRHRGTVSR